MLAREDRGGGVEDVEHPLPSEHRKRVHAMSKLRVLLLLFNTTRMVPGPPSTGVAIAMDGGMADTACYYTGR